MTSLNRRLTFSALATCMALSLAATPALAKTHHHKHHTKTHHARHHAKVSHGSAIVRIAQDHLANLGYYHGAVDGIMGPATKSAIKKFQHDHNLKADGILGSKTRIALDRADHQVLGTHSFLTRDTVAPDALAPVQQDYAASYAGTTKNLSSRFARIDVSESGVGGGRRYNVNLNGQPVLTVDGQPSVIGVSPTYDLGNEDAVVFVTYTPNNPVCTYQTHVLAMDAASSQFLAIDNCTRDYQASVNGGSLYITFPERDDNRAVGATYRIEGMTAERL